MNKKVVTNQQLFDEGKYLDQWDYSPNEIAVKVEWEGHLYVIITSRDNAAVRFPDKAAVPHD